MSNSFLIDDDTDDENETIIWSNKNTKPYFNCGCCNTCLCDDNTECKNCGCNCNCDFIEDDYDYESSSECSFISNEEEPPTVNINIIKGKENMKVVRITLQLNVILSNNKKELISIDIDINKTTYLKIAEDLK
jgi:hypothetical protein